MKIRTNKCNHVIGESTDKLHITKIKFRKGIRISYEIRCKYCGTLFERGEGLTLKNFFNITYFTGDIRF